MTAVAAPRQSALQSRDSHGDPVRWVTVRVCAAPGKRTLRFWLPGDYEITLAVQCNLRMGKLPDGGGFIKGFMVMHIEGEEPLCLSERDLAKFRRVLYRAVATALSMSAKQVNARPTRMSIPHELFTSLTKRSHEET
ncbi:MAG: hypothetical protein Q8P59_09980 [Dehalococcoidia bacterium]|nr:hypothetical protein [Dehalococcoidia bacterium]